MKMTAILLLALGLVVLLRHRSAALRHWVLAAGIACAAAMPILEVLTPAWPLPIGCAPRALTARPTGQPADSSTSTIEYSPSVSS